MLGRLRARSFTAFFLGVVCILCVLACGARTDIDLEPAPSSPPGRADAAPDAPIDALSDAAPFDASIDAPAGDAPIDAIAPDGPDAGVCPDPCTLTSTRCGVGGVQECVLVANGCTAFGPPTACAPSETCLGAEGQAACGCPPGDLRVDGVCISPDPTIAAPRPISPLSTSHVTSHTPTIRWDHAPGNSGTFVEICKDRACANVVTSFTSTADAGASKTALARGLYYFRLRGLRGGKLGTTTSPVWQFDVGARSAATDTSWGTTLDLNGDGLGADSFFGLSVARADPPFGARGRHG
jgi:hypothetical protein